MNPPVTAACPPNSSSVAHSGRRRQCSAALLSGALLLGACSQTPTPTAASGAGLNAASRPGGNNSLGPNVTVFSPSMPVAEIQAKLDAAHAQQVNDEMGSNRFAFLFLPGTYGTAQQPLQIKVGYYTEVAGLGASPNDVVINGKLEVYNRCLGDGGTSNCIALNNFWRTASNLTVDINALGQDGCRASANFWAVSQATSLRRVEVRGGNLSLMDYCTAGPQFASGGFIADSKLPFTINGSQQQWLTRNSSVAGWSNGVWNQVFAGVEGAPSEAGFPDPPYTTLDTTPVSREKPYLYVDGTGAYQVRVPEARTNTRGASWGASATAGRTLPLNEFFVARPTDSVQAINNALARGQHLLLTPGLYDIPRSILVKHANTVVLGLGHATLTSAAGATPMRVADVPGVVIAGVTLDAGPVESELLLQIGTKNGNNGSKKDEAQQEQAHDAGQTGQHHRQVLPCGVQHGVRLLQQPQLDGRDVVDDQPGLVGEHHQGQDGVEDQVAARKAHLGEGIGRQGRQRDRQGDAQNADDDRVQDQPPEGNRGAAPHLGVIAQAEAAGQQLGLVDVAGGLERRDERPVEGVEHDQRDQHQHPVGQRIDQAVAPFAPGLELGRDLGVRVYWTRLGRGEHRVTHRLFPRA